MQFGQVKVARDPLPFPPPLDRLWLNVNKIIDVFHLSSVNRMLEKFSPAKLKEQHPDFNNSGWGANLRVDPQIQAHTLFHEQSTPPLLSPSHGDEKK